MKVCRTLERGPATTQARTVMYDVDLCRSNGRTMTGITGPSVNRTQYRRSANIFTHRIRVRENEEKDERLVDAHPVGSHRQGRVRAVLCASSRLLSRELIFQSSSEVPQDHPCIDKSHKEKNDGDDSESGK